MIGQTLGHYRITEKLGAGGMGEVYRAHDEHLNREVAVKVLPAGILTDEAARKRFKREALTLSKLNHPHIATVHDYDSQDGVDFLVMEYVAGENLADKLQSGPLPETEVVRLGLQIAEALREAHEAGVIHRDLKPRNIALSAKGQIKVLDFGIAKLLHQMEDTVTVDTLTKTAGLSGTLPYMAPEQLRGQTADARSDIHAFGVVLYEMATGRRPFSATTPAVLMQQILTEKPERPSKVQPGISPGMEATILRCLEKKPSARFQTAGDVRTALARPQTVREDSATWHYGQSAPRRRLPGARLGIALGIVVVLVAGVLGWWVWPSPGDITSIAVLPLDNMMGDSEQDYFVEGMHETLITELSKISALKVISRTSTMQYKGTSKPVPVIARELGVDAVIEGSVLRAGNTVRVTTQLIDGRTDRHLWAGNFDRELKDILALHSDVARAIAREIRIAVTPEEETRLANAPPINPEALEAYLKGRHHRNKFTHEGFQLATRYFEQAIRLAPDFSNAYAGLAMTYNMRGGWWGNLPPLEAFPLAKMAARRALELDSHNGEAQAVLAHTTFVFDWDWAGAEIEFKRAIELDPNSDRAHASYSNYLRWKGLPEEALIYGERSLALNPLSPITLAEVALQYRRAGKIQAAEEKARQAIELDPGNPVGYFSLGAILQTQGKIEEAIRVLEQSAALPQQVGPNLRTLGELYARVGRTSDARGMLARLEKLPYRSSRHIGQLHALLGDVEEAIFHFERAYEQRDAGMIWARGRANPNRENLPPHLIEIIDNPRWQAVYRKMNFPVD